MFGKYTLVGLGTGLLVGTVGSHRPSRWLAERSGGGLRLTETGTSPSDLLR